MKPASKPASKPSTPLTARRIRGLATSLRAGKHIGNVKYND